MQLNGIEAVLKDERIELFVVKWKGFKGGNVPD